MFASFCFCAAAPGQPATAPSGFPAMGGIVRNDQGQPISGAQVSISYHPPDTGRGRGALPPGVSPRPQAPITTTRLANTTGVTILTGPTQTFSSWSGTGQKTTAQGRFRNLRIPAGSVILNVFVETPAGDLLQLTQNDIPLADLEAQSAVLTVPKSPDLTGIVVNQAGEPIPGAHVTCRHTAAPLMIVRMPATTQPTGADTGPDGKFTIPHVAAIGNITLAATADGYGATVTRLQLPLKQDLRLIMLPPREVTGRIVDRDRHPIAGVKIEITSNGDSTILFTGLTDDDGRYDAPNLPQSMLLVRATKDDLQPLNGGLITPDQNTAPDITLIRPTVIEGRVTDAVTHQPIKEFTVASGEQFNANEEPRFNSPQTFKDGQYKLPIHPSSASSAAWFVRIEASGHAPMDSDPLHESTNLDIELQPAKNMAGILALPDGSPAAGVNIFLLQAGQSASLYEGRATSSNADRTAATDAQGHFEFPPQSDKFQLFAAADAGYVLAKFDDQTQTANLKLSPWASIEGRAMIGDKPAAGRDINANGTVNPDIDLGEASQYNPSDITINESAHAITDADGKFVVDHLAPGELHIDRSTRGKRPDGGNISSDTFAQSIIIKSGAVEHVTLGGSGRPVTGKVILPDNLGANWQATASINPRIPPMQFPPNFYALKPEQQQQQWRADFGKSEAGLALRRARLATRTYNFSINPDGTFRVDDVIPGDYTMQVMLRSAQGSGPSTPFGSFAPLGQANHPFTMPPIDGGRSDDPLELPDLTLNSNNR